MVYARREWKSLSSASRRARLVHAWSALCSFVLCWAATGCNIVQGFQEAGETLFPQQSTHLAAPGVHLVKGGYRSLGFAVGADIFLLARGADDETGQLYSMRYAAPDPCAIPSVGRYAPTSSQTRKPPLIAYFHEDVTRGTLHFADAQCKTYELTFEDARFPIAETETQLLVWAGTDLWLATPETGERERIESDVDDVLGSVLGANFAVLTKGRIALFDSDWKSRGVYGQDVLTVLRAGNTLFYTDTAGVHRVVNSDSGANQVTDEVLAPDACALGMQDATWVTFRSPCSGGPVLAVHEPTGNRFTLSFRADPLRLKLMPARQSPGLDPNRDPFWFFTLRDEGTPETSDSLVVKTPQGKELTLGTHAALQQLKVIESEAETHGYALIDVAGDTGRYVWWNSAGEIKELARGVPWWTSRLFVDYDGALAKLAVTSGDRLLVLAEGVPWPSFEFRDASKQWTALFHDLELPGQNGQLSVFEGTLDALQSTPIDAPFEPPAQESIAQSVGVFRTSALREVLSGVIYLADFDPELGTGRLEYRNLELRFTAFVNNGVSDYIVAQDQVLYAVPRGEQAGIWLVSGK